MTLQDLIDSLDDSDYTMDENDLYIPEPEPNWWDELLG